MSLLPPVRSTRRTPVWLLLLAACAILGAGCATEQQAANPESGDFSGPDIAFLRQMIPQHEQALELADTVPEQTERQDLVKLADDIRREQAAELEGMEALLERSGSATQTGGTEDGAAFTGEDGTDLRELDGTPFDLAYLDRMIGDHQAAITQAQEVLDGGEHPEVRAMAERIIRAREGELARLEAWRDAWADEG